MSSGKYDHIFVHLYVQDRGHIFECETDVGGIFVMTSHIKKEQFEIPVQGCLYNSKLSHQISVRFPKKATDVDMKCEIQVIFNVICTWISSS